MLGRCDEHWGGPGNKEVYSKNFFAPEISFPFIRCSKIMDDHYMSEVHSHEMFNGAQASSTYFLEIACCRRKIYIVKSSISNHKQAFLWYIHILGPKNPTAYYATRQLGMNMKGALWALK